MSSRHTRPFVRMFKLWKKYLINILSAFFSRVILYTVLAKQETKLLVVQGLALWPRRYLFYFLDEVGGPPFILIYVLGYIEYIVRAKN